MNNKRKQKLNTTFECEVNALWDVNIMEYVYDELFLEKVTGKSEDIYSIY